MIVIETLEVLITAPLGQYLSKLTCENYGLMSFYLSLLLAHENDNCGCDECECGFESIVGSCFGGCKYGTPVNPLWWYFGHAIMVLDHMF